MSIDRLAETIDTYNRSAEAMQDIQEVVLAIADTIASRDELESVRARKAQKRGAFNDKIFLEYVEG